MHENVPVRFGRGRLDSLATKGLAAYLIATGKKGGPLDGTAQGDQDSPSWPGALDLGRIPPHVQAQVAGQHCGGIVAAQARDVAPRMR